MFRFLVLLAVLLAACGESQSITDEQVMRVHSSALLIDSHNDVTSETVKGFDMGSASKKTHTDIARLKAGGVGAVFFAVYVAASYAKDGHAAHQLADECATLRRVEFV